MLPPAAVAATLPMRPRAAFNPRNRVGGGRDDQEGNGGSDNTRILSILPHLRARAGRAAPPASSYSRATLRDVERWAADFHIYHATCHGGSGMVHTGIIMDTQQQRPLPCDWIVIVYNRVLI